ncbi:hypothetical protein GDO78_012411 [Eleutherodactylus coqui]|uniref:Uncharacterized protein n=1 Tax=Eleutherodactylus coqui TaxID=57060 RepID=A0A8J6F0F4_ELECQ|nr:hypothetical protein GDO78_012411 [Eleutherodactylus coqui]
MTWPDLVTLLHCPVDCTSYCSCFKTVFYIKGFAPRMRSIGQSADVGGICGQVEKQYCRMVEGAPREPLLASFLTTFF